MAAEHCPLAGTHFPTFSYHSRWEAEFVRVASYIPMLTDFRKRKLILIKT